YYPVATANRDGRCILTAGLQAEIARCNLNFGSLRTKQVDQVSRFGRMTLAFRNHECIWSCRSTALDHAFRFRQIILEERLLVIRDVSQRYERTCLLVVDVAPDAPLDAV